MTPPGGPTPQLKGCTALTAPGNGSARSHREWLRSLPASQDPCGVPGCKNMRVTDDCCYQHSVGNSDTCTTVPNDGILDWVAIDAAARGLRKVRLTWVEKDIALGMILANGGTLCDAQERLGINIVGARQRNSRRLVAARKIAEALKP